MNRSACVKIKNSLSKQFQIRKGVPQGSALAPPLFCVFVSNLRSISDNAHTVKYADDLNVIHNLPSEDLTKIQRKIEKEVMHFKWLVHFEQTAIERHQI